MGEINLTRGPTETPREYLEEYPEDRVVKTKVRF